ncbi:MAG: outer membrane protein assembly factor BamD [Myxococcales bacterium]|nr:outer membrane protein assembly factor BamD [Myxococcales bacterium]
MSKWLLAVVLAFTAAAPGCSKGGTGKVRYVTTAEGNYAKGEAALKAKDWVAASKYFNFVRVRFPYTGFATMAELGLADAEFGAGEYISAIDSYKLFIRFHPNHERVADGYVNFQIGAAYVKMLPGESWLLPPAAEKDQSPNEEARTELTKFITKYPGSKYRPDAEKLLFKANTKLANHEWYAANFYWKRKKYSGAVLRLRRITEMYAGSAYDTRALLMLGRGYIKLAMPDRATAAWTQLLTKYPTSDYAAAAKRELDKLGTTASR